MTLGLTLLALTACGVDAERSALESDPLDVVVPACVPFQGSEVNPCESRSWWYDFSPHIEAYIEIPEVMWTFKDVLLDRAEHPDWALHFAVRAIAVPGSVRCGHAITTFTGSPPQRSYCYVDLAVNEYLFGNGPTIVTAQMGTNPCGCVRESEYGEQCPQCGSKIMRQTGIEGVEWIMLLGGPYDLAQGAWGIGPTYDVQMRTDGTVVVVDRYKEVILDNSTPENYELNLSRLEWTLDEFRTVVTDAYAAFVELTGGRTGTADDWAGRLPPKLATDAGPAGFNDFLRRTGFVADWPAPPPPVPDAGGRDPDGLRINDIIATRVAGGKAE